MTAADIEGIKQATSMMQLLYHSGSKALGCARHVSDSVQVGVIIHAIDRIVQHIQAGANISTQEFETLIHQCRKRKRKDDVGVILSAMRDIATVGWILTTSVDVKGDAEGTMTTIPPQPQLLPNSSVYAAVVETFLACEDEDSTWQTFQETTEMAQFVQKPLLYRRYFRGCCLLMNSTHTVEVLQQAMAVSIEITIRMAVDIVRLHSKMHNQEIDVILNKISMLSVEEKHAFLEELVESCASCQYAEGVRAASQAMVEHGYARTARTDLVVLTMCLYSKNSDHSLRTLRDFQAHRLLLEDPVYSSLLREILLKCTRQGARHFPNEKVNGKDPRRPALKMLDLRRPFLESIAACQDQMEGFLPAEPSTHDDNLQAIARIADTSSQSHSPMLLLQYVIEATAAVHDKQQRVRSRPPFSPHRTLSSL